MAAPGHHKLIRTKCKAAGRVYTRSMLRRALVHQQTDILLPAACATRFRAHMRKYPHGPNKDKKIQCSRLCMKLSTTPKPRFLLLNISYEFLTSKKYVDSYLIYLETGDNMPAVPKLKKRRLSKNSSKARAATLTVRNSFIIAPPNMNQVLSIN